MSLILSSTYRRNMEPTDDGTHFCYEIDYGGHRTAFSITTSAWWQMEHYMMSMRLRGGADEQDKNYNDIPYLTKRNFIWDGIPCLDFREKIMYPLDNGLGSIWQKGGTLLQTVKYVDPGGVRGNPPRAAATPQQVEDSDARNVKAFHCLLNYIAETSEFFKMIMREYSVNSSGIAIYALIPVYGTLQTPPKVVEQRESSWQHMTMDALRLPYSDKGYYRWIAAVEFAGRMLNKSADQMKEKFISGLPQFFQSEKAQMRHDGTHVYPATYGAVPGHALHPLSATAHPKRGQPYIMRLGNAYFPDWMAKSHGVASRAPPGLVRSITDFDDIVELLSAKDITDQTQCYLCGGFGHPARCEHSDGSVIECANRKLGTKPVVKSNNTDPKHQKLKNEVKALNEEVQALTAQLEETALKVAERSKNPRFKRFNKRNSAHETTDDDTESDLKDDSQADQCSDCSGESEDSHASVVRSMADVAYKGKRPMHGKRF